MVDKSRMQALHDHIGCSLAAKWPVPEKCLNCWFCSRCETSCGGDVTIGNKQYFLERNRELLLAECQKALQEALEE